MAKIVNAKVGDPICYINEHGTAIPGQVSAALSKGGHINLVCFPTGKGPQHVNSVPHYNVDGARDGAHWKKA